MKTVLEFGIRGGFHVDNLVFPNAKLASQTASAIVNSFESRELHFPGDFIVKRGKPRVSWSSSTHFVSVSLLDGEMRGPASSELWKKAKS